MWTVNADIQNESMALCNGSCLHSNQSLHIVSVFNDKPEPVLNMESRKWFDTVFHCLIFLLGTTGVVTNAINLRVFIKQGLSSDSNTVCLFALAVSDFLGCLLVIPWSCCEVVKHTAAADKYESCLWTAGLAFGVPHNVMYRLTCWTTVYIAIERYLCVLIPFKVKRFLKPSVASTVIVSIYVAILGAYVSSFVNTRLEWTYVSYLNTTVLLVVNNEFGRRLENELNLTFDTFLNPLAVGIVAITTGLMLLKLRKYTKWREKTASVGKLGKDDEAGCGGTKKDAGHSAKEMVLMKLVVMITGLFTVCSTMSLLPGIATFFVPGFSFLGINVNLYSVLYQVRFIFDLVNSSLNFFFYIRVSSRYRAAFLHVFKKGLA